MSDVLVDRPASKRLLIWSPNYAPELTGIPPLVTDAAEWLAGRGHRIDVVTPMPNYPERRIRSGYRGRVWMKERVGSVDVARSWLRVRPNEGVVDKALYELTVAALGLPLVAPRARKSDAVLCVIPSLLAAAAAVLMFGRRKRVVLWVQDLVLQGADAVDMHPSARRLIAGLSRLERFVASRSAAVVVCSPGFRDHFESLGVDRSRLEILHNWVDLDRIQPTTNGKSSPSELRVLYSGNIGYSQGLETLVEAARLCGSGVSVDIVGDGNARGDLEDAARGLENVSLLPSVPFDAFPTLLGEHDVHVVVQRRVSAGANFPSKISSYLASGRPIVASIDSSTPAAALLRRSGAALVVEPEAPGQLADALRRLQLDVALRHEMGRRAREFAETGLGRESAMCRLEEILCA